MICTKCNRNVGKLIGLELEQCADCFHNRTHLVTRIAQLEAALAAAAAQVPEEIVDAAKRLDRYLEIGELYCLTDVGTVSDFILQLAGRKGEMDEYNWRDEFNEKDRSGHKVIYVTPNYQYACIKHDGSISVGDIRGLVRNTQPKGEAMQCPICNFELYTGCRCGGKCNKCIQRVKEAKEKLILPAVREAAARLRESEHEFDRHGSLQDDILLICQHVLGREQV